MRGWVVTRRVTSLVVIGLCLATCRTAGKLVSLEGSALPASAELRAIEVRSFALDAAGVRLISIGTYPMDRFDDEDFANLRRSLEVTLVAASAGHPRSPAEPIRLDVQIRQYVVGSTTTERAVWAAVEWHAGAGNDACLYQEVFYATGASGLFGTAPGEKDAVNRSIVERVAASALALASGHVTRSEPVEGTYSTFDAAAASVPEVIERWTLHSLIRPDTEAFRSTLSPLPPPQCVTAAVP
jgi:hypothetical protein